MASYVSTSAAMVEMLSHFHPNAAVIMFTFLERRPESFIMLISVPNYEALERPC